MSTTMTGVQVVRFQWTAIRGALKLEKFVMKRSRRPSARQIVLRASKLPTNTSYDEMIQWCTDRIKEFDDE